MGSHWHSIGRLLLPLVQKNNKVLVVAMFVAFATLVTHIFDGWFSKSDEP